jgi:hypothetical protein
MQDRDAAAFEKEGALVDVSELEGELHKLPYISIDKSKLAPIDVASIEAVREQARVDLERQKAVYEEQLRNARERKPERKRGLGQVLEYVVGGVVDVVGDAVHIISAAARVVDQAMVLPAEVLHHATSTPEQIVKTAADVAERVVDKAKDLPAQVIDAPKQVLKKASDVVRRIRF